MARRRSSLGFLGLFGRSGDLRSLDAALRAADLHPALVPEGVKLTIVNLMKDRWPDEPPPQAYPPVAELFAYCVAGPDPFERANGEDRRVDAERRIETALDAPDSFDAGIVLLALHAKLISAEVVERFGLESDER
jgi:tryptophan 2,3-dioxygenase